ncbi:hypothetical protein [Shinella sp.]|uniref:hypothetical protein n=1 Tax=Shinella sp. TaxID=1870904 RepID=UPI00301C9FE3
MCQVLGIDPQWLNVAGIIGNTIGVAIVALEWRTSMYDGFCRLEIEQDLLGLAQGVEPSRGHEISPRAKKLLDMVDLESIATDVGRFKDFMQDLLILDATERLDRRRRIFMIGFGLMIAGCLTQLVGAWPC